MVEYHVIADLLNKFHTSLPWIQALIVIAASAAIIGVAYFAKEAIREIARVFSGGGKQNVAGDAKDGTAKKEKRKGYEDKYFRD